MGVIGARVRMLVCSWCLLSSWALAAEPTRLFWGDPHVHTSASRDAAAAGCTLGPADAIHFARGDDVTASSGARVRLARPLDWVAVTDRAADLVGGEAWPLYTAAIERGNAPGRFTAFVGFEWTSEPGGDVLHRTVVYRDGKGVADRIPPLTTAGGDDPALLWRWMATWEQETGGRLLAIPHGANRSNGRMFPLADFAGNPLTRDEAALRARWEPLYEITGSTGDGETHPTLSPDDAFAAYERWDDGNLQLVPKRPGMLQREYARRALEYGLLAAERFGANPFVFGFVGGSDSHTGLTTVAEDQFLGLEPGPDRWTRTLAQAGERRVVGWQMTAAGLTGVWATANTRAALWDALARREAYATTGPRIGVRFFGGWGFDADDARVPDVAEPGYRKGVPMGGVLPPVPQGASAPTFLVVVHRDPEGADLDRVQVVKGWLDAGGQVQERVYDVGNGATVAAVWTDPAFDRAQRAFWYVRAVEAPTPRWTAHDAKRFGASLPAEVPATTRERAYGSPIWYGPAPH